MFSGAIKILRDQCNDKQVAMVLRDYAWHFYPYVKDQLNLPLLEYYKYYKALGKVGFSKYCMFHIYCLICYLAGEEAFDFLLKFGRKLRR
jgi:hypothetical protein